MRALEWINLFLGPVAIFIQIVWMMEGDWKSALVIPTALGFTAALRKLIKLKSSNSEYMNNDKKIDIAKHK